MRLQIELEGQVFGRLKILRVFRGETMQAAECICQCGRTKTFQLRNVRNGRAKSCGCIKDEHRRAGMRTTHGLSRSEGKATKVYNTWNGMIRRCYNPDYDKFDYYGGRGITVCERWRDSFLSFIKDMGEPPTRLHSIDRIDCSGNYEPLNCRWADKKTQSMNRRPAQRK